MLLGSHRSDCTYCETDEMMREANDHPFCSLPDKPARLVSKHAWYGLETYKSFLLLLEAKVLE
jgi:hypothetical protein